MLIYIVLRQVHKNKHLLLLPLFYTYYILPPAISFFDKNIEKGKFSGKRDNMILAEEEKLLFDKRYTYYILPPAISFFVLDVSR